MPTTPETCHHCGQPITRLDPDYDQHGRPQHYACYFKQLWGMPPESPASGPGPFPLGLILAACSGRRPDPRAPLTGVRRN